MTRNNDRASTAGLPDAEERRLILSELDRNILVEAAAGTGKTTCIIGRMISLLGSGECSHIRHLAAVTFTRKAAAELRSRFQVELERAAGEAQGDRGENLKRALDNIEQAYIGTIHSFCARLLRERPVEAGVDPSFSELDEEADLRLRKEAWERYVAGLTAHDPDDQLGELARLGLGPGDLVEAFIEFADFPDVEEWPLPQEEVPPVDLRRLAENIAGYVSHMRETAPGLPEDYGNDQLIPLFKRLPRVFSHLDDLGKPEPLMHMLEEFEKSPRIVQREWKKGGLYDGDDAKREKERWERFREEVAEPNLRAWREYRYPAVMRFMLRAREVYDRMRRERGALNFCDLLMKAAALLRENPNVRRYFRRRFTHLLVDEFQDTDPIQAEVLLLLTSRDPEEPDWRKCRPRPGSLFLVGDPKQSIYRFRRADIAIYKEVKDIIGGDGVGDGMVVTLSTNFRSAPTVIDWVNRVFEPREGEEPGENMPRFPGEESPQSPAYVPLSSGGRERGPGILQGLFRLQVPGEFSRKEEAIAYEADRIARTIRHHLDMRMSSPGTPRRREGGECGATDPSDFMIITPKTANLAVYARALQEYGIPHRVTGGSALNEVEELRLLHACVRAVVNPDDPVALVAVLRSELFGISDAALYALKKAGGNFCYNAPLPRDLDSREARALHDAWERLARYSRWFSRMPAAAALERMAGDLGLPALACARPGGDVDAGSLAKAVELLRGMQQETFTAAHMSDYLGRLAEAGERYDGVSARPGERPAVRIMNLHKVKGLEAPVVFLADPSGEYEHDIRRHIDRSGGRTTGYMAVYGTESGRRRPRLLAHPPHWEELKERERAFLRAEALRLRYVAATRSGSAVIITQREKGNNHNPWRCFDDYLPPDAALPDPGPQSAPPGDREDLRPGEAEGAGEAAALRLDRAGRMTYDSRGAKEYALVSAGDDLLPASEAAPPEGFPPLHPPREGEHGVEWGEVLHQLLHLAMLEPRADLEGAALALLAENGFGPEHVEGALEIVRSVMGSDIWHRALRGSRRLTEVPFQVLAEAAGVPTLLRGAMDLVFEEEDGWVIVDYKTDLPAGGKVADLVSKYAPQVRLYSSAWEACTGRKVKEAALYFARADLLIEVPLSDESLT